MATRKWVSSAVGVYRLLLAEQQAVSGSAATAAVQRFWQAELAVTLPAAVGSSSSLSTSAAVRQTSARMQPQSTAGLHTWLPVTAVAAQQQQQFGAAHAAGLHTGPARFFSIPHQDSVKSHLTQPAPLANVAPWEGQLPHQHLPTGGQVQRAGQASAQYEAADAEECDEVMEEYSQARQRVRCVAEQSMTAGRVINQFDGFRYMCFLNFDEQGSTEMLQGGQLPPCLGVCAAVLPAEAGSACLPACSPGCPPAACTNTLHLAALTRHATSQHTQHLLLFHMPRRRLSQLPPGHVPVRVRLMKLQATVVSGIKVAVPFVATLPFK